MLEIVKLGPLVISVSEIELFEKKDNDVHADDLIQMVNIYRKQIVGSKNHSYY